MRMISIWNPRCPEERLSLRLLSWVNHVYARGYHRLTVVNPPQLPREGAAILVCNHISSIDPNFLQAACTYRVITWMVAKEYTEARGLRMLFKMLGAIPVERSGKDTGPLRAALRQLAEGRVIGIFPEGKISDTGQLLEFQTGVALLAIRSAAPVYPVYLDGSQRNKTVAQAFFQRARCAITSGPAIEFDRTTASRENLLAATAAIKKGVEYLKNEVDGLRK